MSNQNDPWTPQLILQFTGIGLMILLGLASIYHKYVQPIVGDPPQLEQRR